MKMTNQRKSILDALRKNPHYMTADELYSQIRGILPRISLATVYRNLEIMAATGVIRKLEMGGQRKCFHHDTGQDDHVICIYCRRVERLTLDRSLLQLNGLIEDKGYTIKGCQIEVSGICPECMNKKLSKEK